MPIILRPAGDTDLSRAQIHSVGALPHTIDGLAVGQWEVGRVTWAATPVTVTDVPPPPPPPPGGGLEAPANLFTAAQAALDTDAHVDGRGNWAVQGGELVCLGTSAGADARLGLDAATVPGHAHFVTIAHRPGTGGTIKVQLGGDGATTGRALSDDWEDFEYVPATAATGAFRRVAIKPNAAFDGAVDDVALYDLSTVDPNVVACDVILIGGDSNASNATSDYVTAANRETAYDPRIWSIPCLRASPTFNNAGAARHVPMPAIEPVVSSIGARRMSPCHAAAAEVVGWSAARGRPVLVMALGDPGSGLMNTEDWRRPDRQSGGPYSNANTPSRMWDEMLAMKAAVEALGPAHEIVGMVWSLGANDRFSGDDAAYEANHGPIYRTFFEDVRADVADVPMVLLNLGAHVTTANFDFTDNMRQLLRKLDQDSGHALALPRFRVVEPPAGNPLDPADLSDPHFNAAGIQANGRAAGAALRALLPDA